MYLVQILLPRADSEGTPFAPEEFDRVKHELTEHFQGVTAYLHAPAEGLWRNGGKSESDDILVFEVMIPYVDLANWKRRRRHLERRFRQDTIIIRYLPMSLV